MRPPSFIGFAALLVTIAFSNSFSQEFDPGTEATIVWAGDSITHQCGYTQYLENFLYTRFHDRRLHFINAGIRGDRASDLLDRFDEDVARWQPQWVTLLLGMNDGKYQAFQRENFADYQRDMGTVLDRLSEIGSRSVVLSPTMFDHHQYDIRNKEADFRFKRLNPHSEYNAKLAFYGGWLRDVAQKRSLKFIDLYGPMNESTARGRREFPDFTQLPDSIHPNPDGMALMAVEMAKYFAGDRIEANRVELRLLNDGRVAVKGGVSVQRFDRNGLQATITPKSLPWVLPASGEVGPAPWNYVDDPSEGFRAAMEGLPINNDILAVSGLGEGVYEIIMDERVVLIVESDNLVSGIQLQEIPEGPSYRQSRELATLNVRRNQVAVRPYRDVQAKMKGARKKFAADPAGFAAARADIEGELERLYLLASEMEQEIHKISVPKSYLLEIRRFQK